MATAIRAIPTLYGETAKSFECEAKRTEQNPGTQDYRHEAKVVSDFLKTTNDMSGDCPLTQIDDERLEAKYMGIGVGRLPLNTRLMYFDLLKIKVNEE